MSQSENQFGSLLDTFDHVVVLMLENRSFDNLLGYLYSQQDPVPPGKQFEGVDGKNISNPIPKAWQFADGNGTLVTEVPVARISGVDLTTSNPPYPDPGEDYPHVSTQLFNPEQPDPFNCEPYNVPFPLHGPSMNGFVNDYIVNYVNTEFPNAPIPSPEGFYDTYKYIMQCYDPADLPVLSGLAREFAVFDHWFCSVPSETICNRNFWHAGTSWGHVINPGPADDKQDPSNGPNTEAWIENTAGATLFSQLANSNPNIDWKIYSDNKVPLFDPNEGILCAIFRFLSDLIPDRIRKFLCKACRDSGLARIGFVKTICDGFAATGNLPLPVTPLLHLLNFAPLFESNWSDLFNTMEDFKADCANGKLPAYSFIEPNFFNPHNDMHPSTPEETVDGGQKISPVLLGEALVWDIYNAIFTSPKHWDNTLLVITFDEHGGCHDHVPPPGRYGEILMEPTRIATPPDLDGYTPWDDFHFVRLGVRVPMVMVSPYIRKNTIINTPMSHTSFLKTMHEKWRQHENSPLPSLSARETASPAFHDSGLLWPTLQRKRMSDMPVFAKPHVPPDNTDYSKAVMAALAKAIMKLIQYLWNEVPSAPRSATKMETHEDAATFLRQAIRGAKALRGRPDAFTAPITDEDGVLLLKVIAEELQKKKLR
jgi:phospholipase C